MLHPSLEDARKLAEWRPPLGVISIYLRFEPGDRGGAWRTELRNGLSRVREGAEGLDHLARGALRATAERVGDRCSEHERRLPRGEVGFVEVATEPSSEHWWSTHLAPCAAVSAQFSERPVVAPLIRLAARGAPRGVALLSAERVRLLDWEPGRIEELHSWELTLFSGDWRERKAQKPADPARAQGVSAAGRDQFDERLSENRQRFLGQCGGLAAGIAVARGWSRIVAFGARGQVRGFRQGVSSPIAIDVGGEADLISEPAARLETPLAESIARLDDERDGLLVERALGEVRGGTRGTAGPQETMAALDEGRVDRLVIDAARLDVAPVSPSTQAGQGGNGTEIDSESLVRRALDCGAGIATVSGAAAELLAPVEGVAALLRY
jgi:hypothetical protein